MLQRKQKGSTKDLVHGSGPELELTRDDDGLKVKRKEKKEKPHRERHGGGSILRSKTLWGAVCVIIGLLVAFVAVPAAQKRAAALTPVVVLTADAPVGTRLTGDMLSVVEVGAGGVPKDAVTNIADAAGKYMTVPGLADDILTAVRLSAQYPTDDPELLALPAGKVAMAVALDSLEQSVASKLRAGDVIQLFAVYQDGLNAAEDTVALVVPELRAVEVLSVTNNAAANITDRDSSLETDDDRQIATVVLAVNQQQAATLAGLTANARLHSALVIRGNDAGKTALLEQQEIYFSSPEDPEEDEDPAEADSGEEGTEDEQEEDT